MLASLAKLVPGRSARRQSGLGWKFYAALGAACVAAGAAGTVAVGKAVERWGARRDKVATEEAALIEDAGAAEEGPW